jgi:DNA-binding Lrp family transcriptional regulator
MDDVDRRIVAALQQDGRATWREIAVVVGSSESTVARRARSLLDSRSVCVTGQADAGRLGLGDAVLVQLKCEAGAVGDVARTLTDRADVRFLARVTGAFDIVLDRIVPSRRALARFLDELTHTVGGIKETATDSVLRTFKTSYDWSGDLLGGRAMAPGAQASDPDPAPRARPLDTADLQLLQLLGQDGRRAYKELAAELGLSEAMVRRRVASMVGQGDLQFATLVDPAALGYEVEAFVRLRVDLGALERIAHTLAGLREVRYLAATSGESHLVCEVIVRSADELYRLLTGTLGSLEGIRHVAVMPELVTHKRAYLRMRAGQWDQMESEERLVSAA